MVVTRSGLSLTSLPVASESSQKRSPASQGIGTRLQSEEESGYDDRSTAQIAEKQSSVLSRKRQSRATGPPAEITEPATDGEASEAESHASGVSSVFEVQESIIRITRKRRVVITPTPKSSVRKRQKIIPQHESLDEGEVSEAESHASGVSMIVPSTERRSRRSKAKSESQESHAEALSNVESSCSGILLSGITPRRTTRNMQKKLQVQAEKKDTKITPEDKKQIMGTPVNSEGSDTRKTSQLPARLLSQTNMPNFSNNGAYNNDCDSIRKNAEEKLTTQNDQHLHVEEEKEASVVSPAEIRKGNCKNLDKEDTEMIKEKEINEKDFQLSLSEVKDTSFQSVSQNHSSTPNNEAKPQPSSPHHESIMKLLEHKFAVVRVERWNEERGNSVKTSDLAQFSDHGAGDDEPTSVGVSDDKNSHNSVVGECDAKVCESEPSMSQDMGSSVLLFLSSDESKQSDNSENERDSVCSVENSGQKESSSGDLEDTACGSALFVIDRTPGLSADKNFYLEDKAPSEVALEEKEEEEDENSEEESSDSDENKDESSDEEDLLNNTKSKLLKLTSSSIDPGLNIKQLGGLYINFNADKLQPHKKTLTQIKEKKKNELLQKAVITPDFEKNYCVPPYSESKHQLQKQRRKERQKTAGNGWFGMKAPELTDELKNDLKALKMRASMDPKRFYKKNDRDGFPKYFQVGTIVDNPADFYHSRIPKKQRKKTIVEELLADSEFRRFNRRKYSEIMAEKVANAAGKKFRKKKKFRN